QLSFLVELSLLRDSCLQPGPKPKAYYLTYPNLRGYPREVIGDAEDQQQSSSLIVDFDATSGPKVGARPQVFLAERYLTTLASALGAEPTPRPFLVEDLVPVKGPTLLAGRSGIGKTPLLFQLGMCVAAGLPFLELKTLQGGVLYIDAETAEEQCNGYLRQI